MKDWLTWNEANHCGEPTCHKARRVARFYNNMRHNCYGCNVVAGDVLDTPTMVPWIRDVPAHRAPRQADLGPAQLHRREPLPDVAARASC